jgi:hypothetical protein
MRKAGRPKLGADHEGLSVVAPTGCAAPTSDEFGPPVEAPEVTQRRVRRFSMESDNIRWRRDDSAGFEVQGGRLVAPDPRNFIPTTLMASRASAAIGIRQVERSRGSRAGLRRRTDGEPRHTCFRRLDSLGELEPSLPLGGPPAIVRNPLALHLEDSHRSLGQEDPTTFSVAHHDAAPAAGAEPATSRSRVQHNRAIRTRRGH